MVGKMTKTGIESSRMEPIFIGSQHTRYETNVQMLLLLFLWMSVFFSRDKERNKACNKLGIACI